ncbi:GMFB factor, partial [Polyodon spathula]|nr:GMFB factor [Polyodon spathula]
MNGVRLLAASFVVWGVSVPVWTRDSGGLCPFLPRFLRGVPATRNRLLAAPLSDWLLSRSLFPRERGLLLACREVTRLLEKKKKSNPAGRESLRLRFWEHVKIDKDKQLVVLDEEYEDISPDDLKDELPERQPRYPLNKKCLCAVYKYQHDDGRVSYPLCFIFSSPVGCKPEQQMMYAGSKNKLVKTVELTKFILFQVFEIRNTEDLTEEWLREKLGFFG